MVVLLFYPILQKIWSFFIHAISERKRVSANGLRFFIPQQFFNFQNHFLLFPHLFFRILFLSIYTYNHYIIIAHLLHPLLQQIWVNSAQKLFNYTPKHLGEFLKPTTLPSPSKKIQNNFFPKWSWQSRLPLSSLVCHSCHSPIPLYFLQIYNLVYLFTPPTNLLCCFVNEMFAGGLCRRLSSPKVGVGPCPTRKSVCPLIILSPPPFF
jgi:hypothetical protein